MRRLPADWLGFETSGRLRAPNALPAQRLGLGGLLMLKLAMANAA